MQTENDVQHMGAAQQAGELPMLLFVASDGGVRLLAPAGPSCWRPRSNGEWMAWTAAACRRCGTSRYWADPWASSSGVRRWEGAGRR